MMHLDRCPWYVAGPLIGLLITGLRATVNRPFGALGGFVEVAEHARRPSRLGFRACLLLGLVLGGAAYAFWAGSFAPSLGYAATGVGGLAVLLGAGGLMGFGARTAGGCTSGHGMTGVSLGSPDSMVAAATFFTVAVGLAHVARWVGGVQ